MLGEMWRGKEKVGRSLDRDGQEGKLEFEDVRIGEMAGGRAVGAK